jgi:Glycosyltransferase
MLASVSSMIDQFNMPNIKLLQEMGYQVDVACNFEHGNTSSSERVSQFKRELEERGINYYQIDFARSITKLNQNYRAYKQVKKLLINNSYSFIHCHSPIGGVIGRLTAKRTNTKVIYTAHGFHFFRGAPLINWLMYYPVERILSRYTDKLITINKEDYQRAVKSFKAKSIIYTPGIGMEAERFKGIKVDKASIRKMIGLHSDDIVLLSVGELNSNKNHETILYALSKCISRNVQYVICGKGNLENHLIELSKRLGLADRVHFLGYRTDIDAICKAADIFIFPSQREGLGMAALEAMASGLPLITSNVHGIVDYSVNGVTGFTCAPKDISSFVQSIDTLVADDALRRRMGEHNAVAVEKYDINNVIPMFRSIYS